MRLPLFAFAWLIVTVSCPGAALPNPRLTGSPFLSLWRAEDYQASPVNWRVVQHPGTGFVYVSNNAGLLEFDGARWTLHRMPRGGPARALLVDAAGRLWVGGIGEIARFAPGPDGRLQAVDLTDQVAAGATGTDARDPGEDEPAAASAGPAPLRALGNLNRAAATPEGVFFRLPDTLAHFPPQGPARLIPAKGRYGQLFAFEGALRAEHLEFGLQQLAGAALVAMPGAQGVRAFAARRDAAGTTWLLTPRGPQAWAAGAATPAPVPPAIAALFDQQEPTCALFLADGRSAYGTTRSGVFVFDAAGRFERRIDRTQGLPANRVNGLAEDREGGLWLAQHAGLSRAQLDSPFAVHGLAQGLAGGPRHLLRAGDRLYVTHGEGLAWRDDRDGLFRPVAGFRTGSHRALALDDGRVVVSAQGLHTLEAGGEVRFSSGPYLYALHQWSREPGWLLASTASALRFYRSDGAGHWRDTGQLATVPSGIDDLLETDDGYLWLVTRIAEVWRVDFRTGPRPDAAAVRYGTAQGLPASPRREDLRFARLGPGVSLLSQGRLLRLDPATGRFRPDAGFPGPIRTTNDGAPAATGSEGWLYRDAELTRVHTLADGAWSHDRFPAPELQALVINHVLPDPGRQTIWLAGQGALVSVDLSWRPARAEPSLGVVLRGLATPAGERLPLPGAAPLPAHRTDLRFEFAAPAFTTDYRGRTATVYRTRLDGFDREWTAWSDEPHRDFTNLPPGRHTLRLEARDFRGRTGAAAPTVFTLAAPWWRQTAAVLLWILLGLLALAGLVGWVTRAARHRAHRLEALVAERTRELQASNAELARLHQLDLDENAAAHLAAERAQLEMLRYQLNPHFLFNAFNSVYGFVMPHSREAANLVRHLAEFCRHTLTRGRDLLHPFAEEFAMLRTYLEIEQLRWRDRLAVTIETGPGLDEILLPPFLLLPLVENAIKHGGATSPGRLEVRLSAARAGAGLVITLANTGRWLDADEPRAADSTGIGLANLRARLARVFPGAHSLEHSARDGWITVTLRLTAPPATPPL